MVTKEPDVKYDSMVKLPVDPRCISVCENVARQTDDGKTLVRAPADFLDGHPSRDDSIF
jgi:hypothetical protein